MEAQSRQVLYIAMSLDGYIATSDDSLDWLFEVEGEGDNGYGEFIKDIDCVILGRRTYEVWVEDPRITSYNVCYTKLLRPSSRTKAASPSRNWPAG